MLWSCSGLSVVYRQDDGSENIALRDVAMSIGAGERIAIVGPNGSGKSTLALVVAGLIQPTSGLVSYEGRPASDPTGAMVFQSPDDNLLGETVRDEMRFWLEQHVEPRDLDAATAATLSRFGLEPLADRLTSQLSGGEKQVVAIAAAMASTRSIIVLDEPTSHLDRQGMAMLWKFLDDLDADSCHVPAIVVVTQYKHDAEQFDRMIALAQGSITYDGSPSEFGDCKPARSVSMGIQGLTDSTPFLSVRDLEQVGTPGWELPPNRLHNISLDIGHCEAIALCGPIGAGKTTLALILAGLLRKFEGERQLRADPPVMLMQFPERQIFCNTVEAEVAYSLIANGIPKLDAINRAHVALDQVGLPHEHFSKRYPFSLSGGQKRRVMLAVAAVIASPLYILDEPQAALDDEGVVALQQLCVAWLNRNSSYILISHDFALLRMLTSRVLLLDRGELRFDGSWYDLDNSPNLLSTIGVA